METKEIKIPLETYIERWDNEIKDFVKSIGAKNHNFEISIVVLFGVPLPKVYSISITFENGKSYGQSATTFRDCFNSLCRFVSSSEGKFCDNIKQIHQPNSIVSWKKYPEEKPTEYGTYIVYRKGCDKQHFETWNNTGWAYNNNDITHWSKVLNPTAD